MKNIKHVGVMKANNAKVLVVFRTLPGDPYHALVLGTSNLTDLYHNAIITLVETPQAQDVNEFGDIMSIRHFPDGRPMLAAMHQDGRLIKVPTTDVIITPNTVDRIPLDQLNTLIAEQKGLAVDELALEIGAVDDKNKVEEIAQVKELNSQTPAQTEQLTTQAPRLADEIVETFDSPESEAKHYRSQADKLAKQAADFRRRAEELSPTKKKVSKTSETVDA